MSDVPPPPRVVLDTQVWLRGLLAKDSNGDAIGPTILRAARLGFFTCVGSSALVYELAAKLRAPRIAKKFEPGQSAELLSLAIALMDPLVAIDGERMGCVDPDDDHVLEAAVKGGAMYVVSDDPDLNDELPDAVYKGLLKRNIFSVTAAVYCGALRARWGDALQG